MVTLSDSEHLRLRFVVGADAMEGVEQKLATIKGQIYAQRELSAGLVFED
ncbi:hypothetical protein SFC07_07070 [Corynebacterium callunae]